MRTRHSVDSAHRRQPRFPLVKGARERRAKRIVGNAKGTLAIVAAASREALGTLRVVDEGTGVGSVQVSACEEQALVVGGLGDEAIHEQQVGGQPVPDDSLVGLAQDSGRQHVRKPLGRGIHDRGAPAEEQGQQQKGQPCMHHRNCRRKDLKPG